MLREQNPSELAVAAPQRSIEEKKQDEQKLLAILNSEKASQQKKQLKYTGARSVCCYVTLMNILCIMQLLVSYSSYSIIILIFRYLN